MGWQFRRGKPGNLLEVFSIRIFSRHITDIRNAKIEGSVQVTDVVSKPMDLFRSKSKDAGEVEEYEDSILPDGTLRLTGPMRCIVAPFGLVDLSLKDKSRDLNLCDGVFHMSPYTERVPFDQRVTTLVTGPHGYAAVHFELFDTAVEAIVEVSLVTDDNNDQGATSLYGSICAGNDFHDYGCLYDKKFFKNTLFHATKEKPKELAGSDVFKSIPLSRSKVAVPMDSNLIIKAQLFDVITEANIVDDTAYFESETSGSVSEHIGGIIIKVNWLVDPWGTPGTVRPHI